MFAEYAPCTNAPRMHHTVTASNPLNITNETTNGLANTEILQARTEGTVRHQMGRRSAGNNNKWAAGQTEVARQWTPSPPPPPLAPHLLSPLPPLRLVGTSMVPFPVLLSSVPAAMPPSGGAARACTPQGVVNSSCRQLSIKSCSGLWWTRTTSKGLLSSPWKMPPGMLRATSLLTACWEPPGRRGTRTLGTAAACLRHTHNNHPSATRLHKVASTMKAGQLRGDSEFTFALRSAEVPKVLAVGGGPRRRPSTFSRTARAGRTTTTPGTGVFSPPCSWSRVRES